VAGAGPNKKVWGGNACLASSTVFFQTLLNASGFKAWQILAPKGMKTFYMPNIAFNMVCGGEHVPGTKQDIQEMFFFAMRRIRQGRVYHGHEVLPPVRKEPGAGQASHGHGQGARLCLPCQGQFRSLTRIKECAGQLGLTEQDYAIGTDNAFSEIQKGEELIKNGMYDMRFSGLGKKTREELIEFDYSVVKSAEIS